MAPQVKVDVHTQTAVVSFDPARAATEDLIRASTAAGYPAAMRKE